MAEEEEVVVVEEVEGPEVVARAAAVLEVEALVEVEVPEVEVLAVEAVEEALVEAAEAQVEAAAAEAAVGEGLPAEEEGAAARRPTVDSQSIQPSKPPSTTPANP